MPWAPAAKKIAAWRQDPPEDSALLQAAATPIVIYQVRAANWAVCQSLPLWLIVGPAWWRDSTAEVGFFSAQEKWNETDIGTPDWRMVKRRRNHPCGSSEILIEVASLLNWTAKKKLRRLGLSWWVTTRTKSIGLLMQNVTLNVKLHFVLPGKSWVWHKIDLLIVVKMIHNDEEGNIWLF